MVAEWTCTTREGLERPMTCRWGPEKNFTMEEVRRYGKGRASAGSSSAAATKCSAQVS
ncbi:hypothetical protein DIPPA_34010 [Diplonema papillatum]|nr:hypothetical protein DIPPA_34010 [Diplonema papillatum]